MPEDEPSLPPDPVLPGRHINWFKRVFWGVVIVVLTIFFLLLFLITHSHGVRKKYNVTWATSNAHMLYKDLAEFDSQYGRFPDESTVLGVNDAFPAHGHDLSGKSANSLLRQLFAAEISENEDIFTAHLKDTIMYPDFNTNPGYALQKHDIGFAYVPGYSTKENPPVPIVLAHIVPRSKDKFDLDRYLGFGKAVILFSDGSIHSYKIEKDGRIYDKGIDLLSPKHPVWKGKKPDIRYPE
jgi:hypothetical protein